MGYFFTHDNLKNILNSQISAQEKVDLLWNTIGIFLQKSLFSKFYNQASLIGLEYDDFYTIAYLGYNDLMKNIENIDEALNNKGFVNFCKNKCIWYCSDYIRSFFSNKNRTLNANNIWAYSKNKPSDFSYSNILEIETEESMIFKVKIKMFLESLNEIKMCRKEKEKYFIPFLKMLLEGKSKAEIENQLNINYVKYYSYRNIIKKKVDLFVE